MERAVFLDRDGVLNRLVFNPATGEYESPHNEEDLDVYPYAADCLRRLARKGYLLFLVSNQPSYAKGKTTIEKIKAVHRRLHETMDAAGVTFTEYYYCYHHPLGIEPGFSGSCRCRKPKPYFLLEAQRGYDLDMSVSWMVGDQDSDIFCGREAGVRTVLVENEFSASKRGKSAPDYRAGDLQAAVRIILDCQP